MTFSINLVEAVWIGINFTALILTIVAYVDARSDRAAVALLNGKARELAAAGLVRREALRVLVQALLLSIAVPGLFNDREIVLTPILAALITVPVVLLVSSFFDARDRKRMTVLVAADILADRSGSLARIETAIAENTRISQAASDLADAAYKEANSVNEKIARADKAIVKQGEDRATDTARLEATLDDTHEKVVDIHERK